KQKKLIMLPSETMIWQPEFTDKTLSRKPGAVQGLYHRQSSDIEIDDTEMTLTILLVSVISNLTSPVPRRGEGYQAQGLIIDTTVKIAFSKGNVIKFRGFQSENHTTY
ncbi:MULTISPECIES: hypothetical protein, partial [Shigella]